MGATGWGIVLFTLLVLAAGLACWVEQEALPALRRWSERRRALRQLADRHIRERGEV